MSDDFSARLDLPYLAAGQMQKHVTLNEALTRLDALIATVVVSRSVAAQPGAPADGDLYILPDNASGAAWTGRPPGALLRFETGGWSVVAAPDGLVAVVRDDPEILVRADGEWRPIGERLAAVQNLTRLGVGTTADAANPLAAKVNAALFTARGVDEGGDGDLRLTLNKASADNVLSLLFQSVYGGRAEIGLIGGDDLSLKVSPDGEVWAQALAVERTTGRVTFDKGVVRRETTVFVAAGDYIPPVWARSIEAVCIGGGGGGGSGMAGGAGSPRFGGGGGGAGGTVTAVWAAASLPGPLAVTVGAAGQGGTATSAVGVKGDNGDHSEILAGDVTLIRATGGVGGSAGNGSSGAGGAGGLGERAANGGGSSLIGGTGGAGVDVACPDGPGGGGAGGGLSSSNVARMGGGGGDGASSGVRAAGGSGSGGPGGAGAASPLADISPFGGGGAGGAASNTGAGSAGGPGGAYGAGGGGGGAGMTTSGPGGAGAPGVVRITAVG